MTITGDIAVKSAPFAAAVAWAAKWKSARPAVAVHGGLRLDAADGQITITAFNGDVTARATVPTEGIDTGSGSAIVSGNLLAALAGTLSPKSTVTLATSGDGQVIMSSGRWTGTLPTFDDEDWSPTPAMPAAVGTVAGDALHAAVSRAGVACEDDPDKQIQFQLIHLAFTPGRITLSATDRYRVARTVVPIDGATGSVVATPMGRVLIDAAAAFAGPGRVTIGCDAQRMSLTNDTRSLVMPLSDPGESGWPIGIADNTFGLADSHNGTAMLRPADLLVPLKRAAITRGKAGPVQLSFTDGLLTIASSDTDLKQDGTEEVEVEYAGPPASMALNPQYLADALASVPGDTVRLRFEVAAFTRRPVILDAEADPDWRHAAVPIVKR